MFRKYLAAVSRGDTGHRKWAYMGEIKHCMEAIGRARSIGRLYKLKWYMGGKNDVKKKNLSHPRH